MSKNFWLPLFIWLALNTSLPGQNVSPHKIVESVMTEFAPDKRVAIFDIQARQDGAKWEISGETNLTSAKTALLNRLKEQKIQIHDKIDLLEPSRGVVNISVCNIRSNPKHSAELSTQSLLGTPIKIYKEKDGWYFVQTPDGYLGWLDDGGFYPLAEKDFELWKKKVKVVVTIQFGLITKGEKGPNVSDIVEGNILAIEADLGRGWEVAFPDGRTGFLPKEHGEPYYSFIADGHPDPEQIIATALTFLGRPYMWGGTSGKGMDCSGFTKTVFYLNGLELPRDASQQVHVGKPIYTDTTLINLKRGDFLFFGKKATPDKTERISHVAIYLGDGKFIHASDRVQIQSLKRGDPDFVEYRLKTLIRAKRMLDGIGENGVRRLADHPEYTFK